MYPRLLRSLRKERGALCAWMTLATVSEHVEKNGGLVGGDSSEEGAGNIERGGRRRGERRGAVNPSRRRPAVGARLCPGTPHIHLKHRPDALCE